jgi:transcriptional regulator with XRE-family HTH domain
MAFAGGRVSSAAEQDGQVRSIITAPGGGGPTVLRILLGAQLRRLREGKRISLEEAGNVIRASHSKISRLETGRVGFKDRDVADLLTFYGVTDEKERDSLRELASRANAQGWWHDYSDVLPNWFEAYVGLEEAATQIRAYEVQFIPGLLQTGEYARAVTLLGHPSASVRDVDRRVGLRLARQVVFTRPAPPSIWAVLDEAVLRRPIGGVEVMRTQIRHLIDLAQRPNVTVQIIPFQAGGHAAAGGPFSILRFAEFDLPDVVYLEQLTSALYLDKPEILDSYLMVMDRLCVEATTPANSIKMMRGMLRELPTDQS